MLQELKVTRHNDNISVFIDIYTGLSSKELDAIYNTTTKQWSGGIMLYGGYYELDNKETLEYLEEFYKIDESIKKEVDSNINVRRI